MTRAAALQRPYWNGNRSTMRPSTKATPRAPRTPGSARTLRTPLSATPSCAGRDLELQHFNKQPQQQLKENQAPRSRNRPSTTGVPLKRSSLAGGPPRRCRRRAGGADRTARTRPLPRPSRRALASRCSRRLAPTADSSPRSTSSATARAPPRAARSRLSPPPRRHHRPPKRRRRPPPRRCRLPKRRRRWPRARTTPAA